AQLPKDLPVEQLVTLIPAEQRQEALDALRLRGPRWRVILEPRDQVEPLARALEIEARLNESAAGRRQTVWRFIDLKRLLGEQATARDLMVALLKDRTLPADERAVYTRDLLWMLLEAGQLSEAHREIDRVQASSTAPEFILLHLERARLFAAEKMWAQA